MRPKAPANISEIRQHLDRRGISVHAVATALRVDPRHLRRVLSGERGGSRALLEAVAELVETMPGRRPQEDVGRLIDAAVHMFFLRRGDFESAVFADTTWNKEWE
jgi:transcriptional regulator with XRE-family HTH domain